MDKFTEEELQAAIDDPDQIILYYQPKAKLHPRQTVGVEALARWRHPQHGILSPNVFIPQLEGTSLINDFTYSCIDKALVQCGCWQTIGLEIPVSVNLSGRVLTDANLVQRIAALLNNRKLPARLLMFEITETVAVTSLKQASRSLTALRTMGIRLAIDDFGAGYSSIPYIRYLPVQEVKIDMSLVKDLQGDDRTVQLVEDLIALAHNQGLSVLAEGVEDIRTLGLLETIQCDEIQGYYLSRPIPANELIWWLMNSTWKLSKKTLEPATV